MKLGNVSLQDRCTLPLTKQTNKILRCGNRRRAARLKRPNTPSDGCKNNLESTPATNQQESPSSPTTRLQPVQNVPWVVLEIVKHLLLSVLIINPLPLALLVLLSSMTIIPCTSLLQFLMPFLAMLVQLSFSLTLGGRGLGFQLPQNPSQ